MRNSWDAVLTRRDSAEERQQKRRVRRECIKLADEIEIADVAETDSEFESMLAEEVAIKNYQISDKERNEFIRDFCRD